MNLANYQAPSPWKNKTQKALIIRSPAFQKKFQDGLPRINHKAIPFHNVYDIEVSDRQIAQDNGLKFWGCVMPERKKYKSVDPSKTLSRMQTQNRGETMFKKYMTRRPSLNLTSRTYQLNSNNNVEEIENKYTTITDFKQQKEYKHNSKIGHTQKGKYEQHYNQNGTLYVTNDQIMAINKKSVYQMTPLQLQISIQWKKRFLEVFDRKVKDAKIKELPFH